MTRSLVRVCSLLLFVACAPAVLPDGPDAGATDDTDAGTTDAGTSEPDAGSPIEPDPYRAYVIPSAGPAPIELHADRETSCAIRGDGVIACWGSGSGSHFMAVPMEPVTQLAFSNSRACAIRADGRLLCWGEPWPEGAVAAPTAGGFKKVVLNNLGGCAIDSTDHLQCWGFSQLTPPTTDEVSDLGAAGLELCALKKADGKLSCRRGNLGSLSNAKALVALAQYAHAESVGCGIDVDGDAVWRSELTAPATVPGPFVRVAAGLNTFCGVKADGALHCWGTEALITGAVPTGNSFADVTVGAAHACARRTDGHVQCWGSDANWKIRVPEGKVTGRVVSASSLCLAGADGKLECQGGPTKLATDSPDLRTFVDVTPGYTHVCGLKADGSTQCWGGGFEQTALVAPDGTSCTQIESGWDSLCCLKADGAIACWTPDRDQALDLNPAPTGPFVEVATGWRWACGRKANDSVSCWGNDVPPRANEKSYKKLYGGNKTLCGETASGGIECIGSPNSTNIGVLTPPSGAFVDVSFEADAACGLRPDGTLACWGHIANTPFLVPPGKFKSVHSGNSSCAVDETDRLHCFWGYVRRPLDQRLPTPE